MKDGPIDIQAAKARLSQLVARAERGERIIIARDGKPVAELGPALRGRQRALPVDEPLLNLDQFAVDGAGGPMSNDDIDQLLYGKP